MRERTPVIPPEPPPQARPFLHTGRPEGDAVLLVHGLTASPSEVRPLADALLRRDPALTVCCPLLPGHGTTPDDLRRTPASAWSEAIRGEVDRLLRAGHRVHAMGVSLGAVLAAEV
ncbi:MAG: alpha/beta fold hydrolase, partial [Planctomycetota bacterium]